MTVNAYYSPSKNDCVPGSYFTSPILGLQQSSSANYGGLDGYCPRNSHALITMVQSDEFGNSYNWWQATDLDHFKSLSQAMITEFDGLAFADQKVNGKPTVRKNC